MLRAKLEEQLKLLKNSSELYDKGRVEEALNIATRLRVLFYDTSNSTSLLKQLNQKKTIKLLSTLQDNSQHPLMKNIDVQCAIPIMLTSNGQRPDLDKSLKNELISIKEWLEEIVITLEGKTYSRIQIITTTANKDGGAHIEIEYKDLKPLTATFGQFTIIENNLPISKDITKHHYILLRQFAYEVLHSEELYSANFLKYTPMQKVKSYNEYLSDGNNLFAEEEYYKASKSYEKAIDVNPNNCKNAYNNMGNALVELGEFEEAINCYKNAIAQDNTYIDALFNLSIRYEKMYRYDLSIELYEKILTVDSNHKLARHNLEATGRILTDLEEQIIFQYAHCIQNESKNLTYLGLLGAGLLKFNYLIEAEIFYTYALSLYPENRSFLNNFGCLLYKQEKYNEAKIIFDKLINLDISEFDILINIMEFKLIVDNSSSFFMEKFKDKFVGSNIIYYELFCILFDVKNQQSIQADILEFSKKFLNQSLNYDFSDIKQWAEKNYIDKSILVFLEKIENI